MRLEINTKRKHIIKEHTWIYQKSTRTQKVSIVFQENANLERKHVIYTRRNQKRRVLVPLEPSGQRTTERAGLEPDYWVLAYIA